MSIVPFNNNSPSSFDLARQDDFFGYGNAMQAIESITPRYSQGNQIVTTVTGGSMPPEAILASSGGTFFDLRAPADIFSELDGRLNRQRDHILNAPHLWTMLENSSK